MSDTVSLDRVIEALETFLHANIDVPLVHLNRIEAAFLLDQLRRLVEYDQNEQRWAAGRLGSSVTDCIGWLYLQKKFAEQERDTAANMNSRMFQAVIDHLQELHGRRAGADRAKAEERKRREEAAKKADEERKRHQEEQAKKQSPFEEAFRQRYEEYMREDAWRAFYGAGFRYEDFASGRRSGRTGNFWESDPRGSQQEQKTPPPNSGGKQRWFEVLGVSANATADQIRRAYRKLAAKHHPDRPGGSHEKMRDINAARDEGLSGLRA